jgi:hypothetical protein
VGALRRAVDAASIACEPRRFGSCCGRRRDPQKLAARLIEIALPGGKLFV